MSESQQEKLLQKLNDINFKLDDIFFHISENKPTDKELTLLHMKMDIVLDTVSGVVK